MFALIHTLVLKSIFIIGITLFGLFAFWYHYQEEYLFQYFENDDLVRQYDYIVVGAGSAGAILALRLSQQNGGSSSVLLLEAGSYGGSVLNIPLSSPLIQLTHVDWQYKTAPQANACKAFDNNQCLWPRGKLVGGSSRLNNMIYVEGHPTDYPPWFSSSDLTVNYSKDIKPYFERIKSYLLDDNHVPFSTELSQAFLEAGREVFGVPTNEYKSRHEFSTGFMVPMINVKNGRRFLSGEYLMANKMNNLKVLTHSYVEKVIFERQMDLLKATGVVFKRFGKLNKVFACKAVILSAGTISSPHILMLSGLGPSSDLASHFISPLLDLPQVGQNLQDHITTGIDLFHLKKPLESITLASLISPWTFLRYNLFGEGPWTFNQCDSIAILYLDCLIRNFGDDNNKENARRLNETYDECERRQNDPPDLQLALIPMGFNADLGIFLRKIIRIKEDMWENYISHYLHIPTFFILPIVLHPKSVGYISLASSSPDLAPIINPNYLSHPYDVSMLVRGLKIVQDLVDKGIMFRDKLGAKLNTLKVPGCVQWEFGTWEYWECYVREVTLSMYHPIGTCKMGTDAKSSVVDIEFLVHGTKNLYVVDASVMPTLPSGNINGAVIMLAEKASDVILKKYSEYIKSDNEQVQNSECRNINYLKVGVQIDDIDLNNLPNTDFKHIDNKNLIDIDEEIDIPSEEQKGSDLNQNFMQQKDEF